MYYLIDKDKNKIAKAHQLKEHEVIALGHPIRIKILDALSKKKLNNRELSKQLRISEQLINYHLKFLINSGLIKLSEKKQIRGTTARYYSLTYTALAILFQDNPF